MSVFKDQMDGTIGVETSHDLFESLGRADEISVQAKAANATGTSPTLTVALWGSNDGANWVTVSTLVNAADISSSPYESLTDTTGTTLPAFLKFVISLGGTNPTAFVSLSVCGRTE